MATSKKKTPAPEDPYKEFFSDYLQSPMYRKRLVASNVENPDLVIAERLGRIPYMKFVNAPGQGNGVNPRNYNIELDAGEMKKFNLNPTFTKAHEASHFIGSMSKVEKDPTRKLTPMEESLINVTNKRHKLNARTVDQEHDGHAWEAKADIDALRYLLFKDGIYDTKKRDFNKKDLEKAKGLYKNTDSGRLFKNFKDADLIYLMNNIASVDNSNSNDIPMAATGGKVTGGDDKYRDPYYESSAKLLYYRDQLNKKLRAKNTKGYDEYNKGLAALRPKQGAPLAELQAFSGNRAKYIEDSEYNDYLTPEEVQKELGDKYLDYLSSIQTVNKYNIAQGQQPLYGTIEGENDVTKLNYGRRFASLQPNTSATYTVNNQKDNSARTYSRSYAYNPETNSVDSTESGDLTIAPSWLKPITKPAKMANGGSVSAAGTGSTGTGNMGWLSMIPGMLDTAMSLADPANNPNNYSKQPIVNAQTMKGMATPYTAMAMGGELGFDMDEEQLAELQALAEAEGVTVEEIMEMLASGQGIGEGEEGEQIAGEDDVEEMMSEDMSLADEFEEEDEFDGPNSFSMASGGRVGSKKVEIEGQEVIETPDGQVMQAKGPSHEKGGIKTNLPIGTDVYSKRLQMEGKSMKDRKLSRERKLAKLDKLLERNPYDKLAQNSAKRTMESIEREDRQDMALQKAASQIYQFPKLGAEPAPQQEFAVGGQVDPYYPNMMPGYSYMNAGVSNSPAGSPASALEGMIPGFIGYSDTDIKPAQVRTNPVVSPAATLTQGRNPIRSDIRPVAIQNQAAAFNNGASDTDGEINKNNFTPGDYVGMAGGIFNAVAPIINTLKNRKAQRPNRNRFEAFGRDALDTNQRAMDNLQTTRAANETAINTGVNASYNRNNNSATSVNTARALNTVTDMNRNKANLQNSTTFANQVSQLLGQRAGLQNQRDQVVMRGEAAKDMEDKADIDNFYSNMAQNLTNFGTNVQGLGRNLNQSAANKSNVDLLNQMGLYTEFDANGKLVNKRNG